MALLRDGSVLVDAAGSLPVLVAGLCLGALALVLLGLFGSYPWLLATAVLLGVANSVYHPADYDMLSRSIGEARIGRAFSVHTFAGFLGGALAPGAMLGLAFAFGPLLALLAAGLLGLLAPSSAIVVVSTTTLVATTAAATMSTT